MITKMSVMILILGLSGARISVLLPEYVKELYLFLLCLDCETGHESK